MVQELQVKVLQEVTITELVVELVVVVLLRQVLILVMHQTHLQLAVQEQAHTVRGARQPLMVKTQAELGIMQAAAEAAAEKDLLEVRVD